MMIFTKFKKVNINGFINILEQSRKVSVKQIVYASSSSVYGLNRKVPFSEDDKIETCNSPYACSKRAMEIYGKTYNQLYGLILKLHELVEIRCIVCGAAQYPGGRSRWVWRIHGGHRLLREPRLIVRH